MIEANGRRRACRVRSPRGRPPCIKLGWRPACGVLLMALAASALGCGTDRDGFRGELIVACSDSAVPVLEREAASFALLYPGARVVVVADDSRGALSRLTAGQAALAIISRGLAPDEADLGADADRRLVAYGLAVDAVAFVVHPGNGVDSLDLEQLASVLAGTVTSWAQVGGAARPVVRFLRDRNSGTYEVARQAVLGGRDYGPGQRCATSAEVVARVAEQPGAIGCVGLAWLGGHQVSALRLAAVAGGPAVAPTAAAVYQNRYPVRRPVLVCQLGEPKSGLQAGFVAFLTSPRGQIVVESEGLVPKTVAERAIQLR